MSENNLTALSIIQRIFSSWTALKMAVEHGMGSKEQAHRFCEYIEKVLEMNEKLDQAELANELEEYMDSEFNTQLEDNSDSDVADVILRFHRYIIEKDFVQLESEVAKLPVLQDWIIPYSANKVSTIVNNVDNENSLNSEMEVDSEGFTLVTRKK